MLVEEWGVQWKRQNDKGKMDNKNNKTPQKEAFIFIAGNNSFFVKQEQTTYGIFSFSAMTLLTPLQVWRPPSPWPFFLYSPELKTHKNWIHGIFFRRFSLFLLGKKQFVFRNNAWMIKSISFTVIIEHKRVKRWRLEQKALSIN